MRESQWLATLRDDSSSSPSGVAADQGLLTGPRSFYTACQPPAGAGLSFREVDVAIGYSIDPEHRVVFLGIWDIYADEDLAWFARALKADARFRPEFDEIVDMRGVSEIAITGEFLRRRYSSPFGTSSRRALVTSTPGMFGIARMYQLAKNLEQDRYEMFSELPSAFAWLNLPSTLRWPVTFPDASRNDAKPPLS